MAAFLLGMVVPRAPAVAGVAALVAGPILYGIVQKVFGSEIHFLLQVLMTFVLVCGIMAVITVVKPMAAPKTLPVREDLDWWANVVANKHLSPGKKQWTWGNHEFGWAWDRELTDEGGPYVELMAGVYTDNQPDFSYLAPYETKTFSQYWWPYQKLGRGQFEAAAGHFETAMNRLTFRHPNPETGEAHYYLGLSQRFLGNLEVAYPLIYKAT